MLQDLSCSLYKKEEKMNEEKFFMFTPWSVVNEKEAEVDGNRKKI
jgi:hypothetical protein